jgi:long-chain acyl-CoA synthetase
MFIKDVFIVGLERDHVSALIDIDLSNCGKWAEKKHIAYTTRVDLSQKQEICDLIQGEIETVNRMAPEHSRVKRFVNLHKEFDPDEAEMTRTRKLKRNVLEDKYKDIVDAIYTPGAKEIKVRTEVKYRDGRKGTIDTELKINTI